jgi:hypothetical protein
MDAGDVVDRLVHRVGVRERADEVLGAQPLAVAAGEQEARHEQASAAVERPGDRLADAVRVRHSERGEVPRQVGEVRSDVRLYVLRIVGVTGCRCRVVGVLRRRCGRLCLGVVVDRVLLGLAVGLVLPQGDLGGLLHHPPAQRLQVRVAVVHVVAHSCP